MSGEFTMIRLSETTAEGSYIAPFKLGDKIYAPGYGGCSFAIYYIDPPGGWGHRRFVAVHSYRTWNSITDIVYDWSGLDDAFNGGQGTAQAHWDAEDPRYHRRKGSIFSILQQPDQDRPEAARGWKDCVPPFKTGADVPSRLPGRPNIPQLNEVFVESRLEGGNAVMYLSVRAKPVLLPGVPEPAFKRFAKHIC